MQLKTLQYTIHSHSVIVPQPTLYIVQSSLTNVLIYVEIYQACSSLN